MTKHPKNYLLHLAISGILIGGAMPATPLLAADLQEEVTVAPGRTISTDEERILSRAAARTLRHIAQARAEIHAKDLQGARDELQKARALLEIIKTQRPTAKLIDHIWVARKHLDYKTTEEVAEDLIPIETELMDIEDLVPTEQARKHLAKARSHLKKGDKSGANEALQGVENALVYIEVDLPVSATDAAVTEAVHQLAAGKPDVADLALARAENSVQFLAIEAEAPLGQASRFLSMARQDYANKDLAAVKRDLRNAQQWLGQVGKETEQDMRSEVDRLSQQLDALTQRLEKGGEGLTAALDGAADLAVAMAEREVEKVATGWQRHHVMPDLGEYLSRAKWQVAIAENIRFSARDDKAGAIKYLDDAVQELKQAQKVTGLSPAKAQQVDQALAALDAARQHPDERQAYEQARAILTRLLNEH